MGARRNQRLQTGLAQPRAEAGSALHAALRLHNRPQLSGSAVGQSHGVGHLVKGYKWVPEVYYKRITNPPEKQEAEAQGSN